MAERSIYEVITDSIVDGVLPHDFSLEQGGATHDRISFADGVADGIAIYHMARPELPPDLHASFERGIAQACVDDYEGANATFGELTRKHRAVELIDEMQRYVLEHSPEIDAQALWAYATFLLFISPDKELVKIGLSLLELFGELDEQVKQVVRTLGLSDEFTLFAAWCARSWSNANDELFELAKNVHGWGRVHVVEMLEPETDEIRGWLFHEGAHNSVLPDYSALACYLKAGVPELLAGAMSHGDFSAATFIVKAALGNGPVAGILALEDPEAELGRYVSQAAKQPLDADDRACLAAIANLAERQGWDELASACGALLGS